MVEFDIRHQEGTVQLEIRWVAPRRVKVREGLTGSGQVVGVRIPFGRVYGEGPVRQADAGSVGNKHVAEKSGRTVQSTTHDKRVTRLRDL